MTALLVLNYDVHDDDLLHTYREAAAPVILGSSGQLVTSTDSTHHLGEGDTSGGTHTVVLAYADVAEALARYESTEYRALLEQRLAATTPRAAFVVEATLPST